MSQCRHRDLLFAGSPLFTEVSKHKDLNNSKFFDFVMFANSLVKKVKCKRQTGEHRAESRARSIWKTSLFLWFALKDLNFCVIFEVCDLCLWSPLILCMLMGNSNLLKD